MKLPSRLAVRARQTRRDIAVLRPELRGEALREQRQPAAGVTSPAVKVRDPKLQRMIDDWKAGS